MALPQTSDSLGNVLRLQGLKNVSGRKKILPGAQFLQNLDAVDSDVAGTSNDMAMPQANIPELEMGAELSPQSYDVRANQVLSPEAPPSMDEMQEPEQESVWTRFGKALAMHSGQMAQEKQSAPPIETQQVDLQEGIAPVSASQQVQAEEEMPMGQPPSQPEEMASAPAPAMENSAEEVEPLQKEPGTYTEVGAIDRLLNDPNSSPELKDEIERIFNTSLTPELTRQAQDMEKVVDAYVKKLDGVDVELEKRLNTLLKKVENRDLSTQEQIAMALALVAPALIAGIIGGKEGLAYGLAEGGKNVANSMLRRDKDIKEAEELLPEIASERANVAKEKLVTANQSAELKRKIQESVPNHPLRQLFNKDGMILNGKLVLNTGNPLLPLKSTAVRSEKDFDTFREKKMPELADKISTTEQGLHLLDNLRELVDITEAQNTGVARDYIPFYDITTKGLKALVPAGRDTFRDENGNEVKISELYETTLEQLSDMYSQAVGAAGSKTAFKTYREHFREMLPNPYTAGSFVKGRTKPGTIISQINSVKDKFEDNIVKKLDTSGVDTDPIKELFRGTQINSNQSEVKRKNDRANEAVRQTLGK